MAWTDPRTWTALDKVRAADLNTDLRDNLAYLKEQADALQGSAKVATQAYGSVLNETIAPGNSFNLGLLPIAFTIPFAGVVLTSFVLQLRMVTASYVRAEVSPGSGGVGMSGGAWVWDMEAAYHPLRTTLTGHFLTVVDAGPWEPSVTVLNHADSTDDIFLNQAAGMHLLTSDFAGFVP